jgi:ribosomal protein S18 acetylase RimI-like enzyme
MERFYDGEQAIAADLIRERLGRALEGQPDGMIIMALREKALGFAALSEIFPGTALRTLWYLKDLYVRNDARRRTIGEGLMRAAAREVIARGGHRLEFTTDSRNEAARRFYVRLGARQAPKVFYQFLDADLEALASK